MGYDAGLSAGLDRASNLLAMSDQTIRLHAGELTRSEMRAVRAVMAVDRQGNSGDEDMTVESTLAELFHTHRNAPSLWLAEQAVRIVREADEAELRLSMAGFSDEDIAEFRSEFATTLIIDRRRALLNAADELIEAAGARNRIKELDQ